MDKIEEVKKLLWILDSKHNVSVSKTKENIDYIADEIVKLFCQPAVSGQVCEHYYRYLETTEKGLQCKKCMTLLNKQTLR